MLTATVPSASPSDPQEIVLAEHRSRAAALGRKSFPVGHPEPPKNCADPDEWEPTLADLRKVHVAFLSDEGYDEMLRIGRELENVGAESDDEGEDQDQDGAGDLEEKGMGWLRMTTTSSSYQAVEILEREVGRVKAFMKEKSLSKAFERALAVTCVFEGDDFWHQDTDIPDRFQRILTTLRGQWRTLLKSNDAELGIAQGDDETRAAVADLIKRMRKTLKEGNSQLKF